MEQRYGQSPKEVKELDTTGLRENFLIETLMQDNAFNLTYSHYDRAIIGTAKPIEKTLELPNFDLLRAEYFLERRELGIINVGGQGEVTVEGQTYKVNKLDAVYAGKGAAKVAFKSLNTADPALFYLYSVPAHHAYPHRMLKKEEASPMHIGSKETANERTVYKYIHLEGIQSCQLVMGLTILEPGCVWNTMPAHTHDRRMEAYFYFDIPQGQVVFHFMGQPMETRHIVVQNHQAVISPPWSIHSGSGTSNYGFIWSMCGENLVYSDMDIVKITDLR